MTDIYNKCICSYIYSDHVYFCYSGQNVNVAKRVVNFRFGLITKYASDFCLGLSVGPPAELLSRLCGSLYRREFLFCARWEELRIFVNKTLQESFSRFLFFCLTKQKGSIELILLVLQSNSTGSVLINDGTLGAGIKKLKPGAAAP